MKDYAINVFFSEEDDCYVADIPDLRYCSASGPTPENAVKEVVRAKKVWLKRLSNRASPFPNRNTVRPVTQEPRRTVLEES